MLSFLCSNPEVEFTVDEADADLAKAYNWHCRKSSNGAFYVYRYHRKKMIAIYHDIAQRMGLQGLIDHKDGNPLNNTRDNLRRASHIQNSSNRARQSNNSSGFKGVSWNSRRKKWLARIAADGKEIQIGQFADPAEAARAYDKKAKELHGQFARLNFPQEA